MRFTCLVVLLTACSGNDPATADTDTDTGDLAADLAAANHCELAADCVDIGTKCPYGCAILVHADEADALRERLDAAEQTCDYSCVPPTTIECTDGTCAWAPDAG